MSIIKSCCVYFIHLLHCIIFSRALQLCPRIKINIDDSRGSLFMTFDLQIPDSRSGYPMLKTAAHARRGLRAWHAGKQSAADATCSYIDTTLTQVMELWGESGSPWARLWSVFHDVCGGDLYNIYCIGESEWAPSLMAIPEYVIWLSL